MQYIRKILNCFIAAYPKAIRTAWWMIRIMLPVSLSVTVLQYYGFLSYLSQWLTPVFQNIGLPGESALVYLTSVFLSIYAAIAVIGTLALDMREITILAIMCLIAHNMIVETAIQKKTGSKVFQIVVLRITGSFAGAFLLHWLLPAINEPVTTHTLSNQNSSLPEILEIWLNGSFWLSIKVILIVVGLLFLQKVLDEFGVMNILSKIFKPLMKPMGLSENTSFHWLIANAIGLTYGSAVLIEQVETQKITPKEADLLNQHIAINHSMLEDTLLFVAIGVSAFWITFPRIAIAIAAVWIYRFLKR